MTAKDLIFSGGGALLLLMTLVQIAPIKLNPWSRLAQWIGKAINADTTKALSDIKEQLDRHITMDDRRTAEGHRAGILHFNNELLRNIDHTKEEFIEVLLEIDAYETYCREHPDYPNNRAILAIGNIKRSYKDRLCKHDFLDENGKEGLYT